MRRGNESCRVEVGGILIKKLKGSRVVERILRRTSAKGGIIKLLREKLPAYERILLSFRRRGVLLSGLVRETEEMVGLGWWGVERVVHGCADGNGQSE